MQYLLSEEEMEDVRRLRANRVDPMGLANVCKHVASTMVSTVSLNGHGAGATRPNGCPHVPLPQQPPAYCDHCQVRGVCPLPKNLSK